MRGAFCAALIALLIGTIPLGARASITPEGGTAEASRRPVEGSIGPAAPLAGPIDPTKYRLGPGDALAIYMYGRISQTWALEVGPDGTIFVPELGSLPAAGRSLDSVRRDLEDRVAAHYRDVRIEVRLERRRQMVIYLAGAVRSPGPRTALGSMRPVDVLSDSMLTPDASRRNIEVLHRDGRSGHYDLMRFLLTGAEPDSVMLEDGDVLRVPIATEFVGIWGAVGRPGRYELGRRDSLSSLIALAGGLNGEAFRDRAVLVRSGGSPRESVLVSPSDVTDGRLDLPLQPGDQLYVLGDPERLRVHNVSVLGLVQREGSQSIVPGVTRLSGAIAAAGGFREGADTRAIRLIRTEPNRVGENVELERLSHLGRHEMTNSEYEAFRTQLASLRPEFRVDWSRVQSSQELDPLLQDDDLIQVDHVQNSIRVDGQVLNPGVYEYSGGKDWSYYVHLAGGFTPRAARTKVLVKRLVNAQTVPAGREHALMPGDFVWVPERPDTTVWEIFKEVLTAAAAVATVYIAYHR